MSGLATSQRVAIVDAALAAVRATMRAAGLCEVVTPVRLDAVAIEPWIEPVAAPPGWLATSPELPMKRLLCRGAPPIFQIAPVLRRAERGRLHREEFRLVEWYRHGPALEPVMHDVQAIVAAVADTVAVTLAKIDRDAIEPGRRDASAVAERMAGLVWRREGMLDLVARTTSIALRGDEDAVALRAAIASAHPDWIGAIAEGDPEVAALDAWTALFSAWSDAALDPWLASLHTAGVHVVEFPPMLAALAEVGASARGDRIVGHRFESHVVIDGHAVELANGYRELRDADEQRRRFDRVAGLRAHHRLPALPMPGEFLDDLRAPGLPPVAGAALGFDRLVMIAAGQGTLDDLALLPEDSL